MFMNTVEIVGGLAALTSTVSLIPQITKVLNTCSTQDLSRMMLFNFLLTSVLWVWYGAMINSLAVWGCNLIMTVSALFLVALKKKFG